MNPDRQTPKGYDHKATAVGYWIFAALFLIAGIGALFLTWRHVQRSFIPAVAVVARSRMVDRSSADTEQAYLSLVYEWKADGKVRRYREPSCLVSKDTPDYDTFALYGVTAGCRR